MAEKNRFARRNVLRNVGSFATGVIASSGIVVSKEEVENPDIDDIDILGIEQVSNVKETVGDPEIERMVAYNQENDSLSVTELKTDIGTLKYSNVTDSQVGRDCVVLFTYDDLNEHQRSSLPRRFRNVPKDTSLVVQNDGDGGIAASRTISESEKRVVLRLINSNTDNNFTRRAELGGVISELTGDVKVKASQRSTEEEFAIQSDSMNVSYPIQRQLQSPDDVEVLARSEVILPQDCGGIIFNPCSVCAASSAGVAVCAPACATKIACAVCLIGAGYAINQCCVCLSCIDSFDWDDHPDLQRTCPEDVVP